MLDIAKTLNISAFGYIQHYRACQHIASRYLKSKQSALATRPLLWYPFKAGMLSAYPPYSLVFLTLVLLNYFVFQFTDQ
jgi:hypothetical protein